MRGWAASPDFLRNLMQYTEDNCPTTIVECSSGVSTLVLARRVQLNGAGHVYSLEHDAAFAQKTRLLLRRFDLEEFATVYHAPLTNTLLGDWDGSWYDTRVLPELVTVDLW
jgi:predicted O-methyltransferase YrrM